MSVSLCRMHGHSFWRIWAKFRARLPCNLWMVMRGFVPRDRATPERRRRDHRVKESTKGLLAAGQYTADHRRAGLNAFAKAATVVCVHHTEIACRIADITTEMDLIQYNCCKVPYSQVKFTLQLQRKTLYYVVNMVLPCCVFSVLSIITFILPPACGERVGVGQPDVQRTDIDTYRVT